MLGPSAILQISGVADRDEKTEEEEYQWHARYLEEMERVVNERGWKNEDVAILMGGGHHMLH